jgi:hypothetical protein
MKINQLREFVKQVVREEQDYQQLFKHMLDKSGKSIPDMSDDEKKKFFGAVDTAYKAKSEGRLRGYNESINEISSIDGLNDVVKGQTSHIEGIKLSKDMAEHIISWMNTSPYGKKYNSWVKKNSIEKILPIAFNWGLERYLPSNLKNEFSTLKAKYGKAEKKEELTAGQKKIDVDGDGEIEGSDLAKLRANKDESINEEEIKWNAVENAIINFLKMNTKILDKRVKDRDTDGVKGGLQSIIDGLTNAQRSLKLK